MQAHIKILVLTPTVYLII